MKEDKPKIIEYYSQYLLVTLSRRINAEGINKFPYQNTGQTHAPIARERNGGLIYKVLLIFDPRCAALARIFHHNGK